MNAPEDLFQKFINDDYTETELKILLDYFELPAYSDRLKHFILEWMEEQVPSVDERVVDEIEKRLDRKIRKRVPHPVTRLVSPVLIRTSLAIAAVLLVALTLLFFQFRQGNIRPSSDERIHPGASRATLTLSDGRQFALSEKQDGITIEEGDLRYIDGTPLVDLDFNDLRASHLSLSTPYGGTYRVTLPDGSLVWLNAGSTLTYPTSFSDKERTVELSGEAYFEVRSFASSGGPMFRVKTTNQLVEVLGTHFNVKAYVDEHFTQTTLVEGSLRIRETGATTSGIQDDSFSAILEVGEQGMTNQDETRIHRVDLEQVTAWTKGDFIFHKTPLAEVMSQLERWYDIQIDAGNIDSGITLTARISRNTDLQTLLYGIEKVSNLTFHVNERRVHIMDK